MVKSPSKTSFSENPMNTDHRSDNVGDTSIINAECEVNDKSLLDDL